MGSFPVDIDLRIDPRSALKAYETFTREAKALMAQVVAGVEGADKKLVKLQENFARDMISTSTRQGRAIESSIKSLERQAEMAGKTYSQQLLVRQEKWVKMLGEDEKAVKRVTAAFQQLIKAEQEAEAKRGGHGGMMSTGTTANLIFRGTKDIFEGRTTYAAMDFITAAKRMQEGGGMLSGATMGVVGFTAALTGFAVASAHAAKSMGEYGEHLRDIQSVTGMSVVEVQKLEVAAKMTGHSIEDYEKGMRGLTQALAGEGSAAVKAAKDLKEMGVDVVGLRLGTISTYEAMEQLGEALRKNPDTFKTNIEMMEIFKKSGLNLKYTLDQLADSKAFREKLHVFSEDDVKKMDEMDKFFDELGAKTAAYFKQLKFFLAQEFMVDIKVSMSVANATGGISQTLWNLLGLAAKPVTGPIGAIAGAEADLIFGAPPVPGAGETRGESESLKAHRKTVQEQRSAQFATFIKGVGTAGLEGAEQKLREIEKDLNAMHAKTIANEAEYVKDPTAFLAKERQLTEEFRKQKDLVEAMRKAESDRKNIVEALRRLEIEATQRREHPYGMLEADQKMKAILEMPGLKPADRAAAAASLGPLRYQEVQLLLQKAQNLAGAAATQVAVAMGEEPPKSATQFAADERAQTAARNRALLENIKRQEEKDKEALGYMLQIQAENRKNEEASAMRGVRLGGILQPSTVETRLAAESQIAAIKEQNANQEADDARNRLAKEYMTKENYENALLAIRLKNEGEVDAARGEYQAKYLEELRHQLDEIKGKVEPLFDTLFKDPKNFGKQLRSTITDATLKPITSGLSEMTAVALHPLIFGATGTGGIAGGFRNMFGGGRLNDVRLINGAVPVHIVGGGGGPGGGGGGIGTSIYNVGGFNGGSSTYRGGFSPANFGLPSVPNMSTGPVSGYGWDTGATYSPMTGGFSPVGPGGTPGFAPGSLGIPGFGGGGGGGGFNLGGGMSLARSWAGLKQFFGQQGGTAISGETMGGESLARIGGQGMGGGLKGFAHSPAARAGAGAVGMMLAQHGLLGSNRGTVGGVFEGMFGGAGVGFAMGGPIGAAIGAAAGLGIGLGELIAGVETPVRQAKRLVHSLYHISINDTTANQIVSIATQSYGGRVSIAVRAPEVRHMLGLYAAGTGQSSLFAQGANEPHGASLVESGGRLMQQATYQYGQAFSQSSNLPIYGGVPTQTYGGGNMNLSLNIGGHDAARFLQGNVVSPDVVQTQYSAAMRNSSGRVGQALMMSEPGSIAS